jgi:hypothetical protein
MTCSDIVVEGVGETLDALGDLLVGGLEGLVGVDPDGVGHGPVQLGLPGGPN